MRILRKIPCFIIFLMLTQAHFQAISPVQTKHFIEHTMNNQYRRTISSTRNKLSVHDMHPVYCSASPR